MGNHSSTRTRSGHRRGLRQAAIVGIGACFVSATVIGVGIASGTASPTPSVYSALAPVTVLSKSLAAASNTDVTVAGVNGVPANATSVQLSVTALSGTTTSSMYVYPTGATKPTSANVRWQAGETVTIPVTVAVGTGGKIHLATDGGTVTVKVAVVGYFSPAPTSGSDGYAAFALNSTLANNSNGGTTVASLTVPAGTYEIHVTGSAYLANTGGTDDATDEAVCSIFDPAGESVASSETDLSSIADEETVALTGLDTTSGGTITFHCNDVINDDVEAVYVDLVAIRLSSATGVVTGG